MVFGDTSVTDKLWFPRFFLMKPPPPDIPSLPPPAAFPEKQGAWYQSLSKYWANPASPTPFVYRVDLGERKAGVMGMQNEWSREKKKFVNAPLPPLKAFGPGTCRFSVVITCWGKTPGERVAEVYQDFDAILQK